MTDRPDDLIREARRTHRILTGWRDHTGDPKAYLLIRLADALEAAQKELAQEKVAWDQYLTEWSDDRRKRQAAEARVRQLEEALTMARAYVEEPGAPGTIVETTEESATRSAALLVKIDEVLAAKENT